MCRCYGLVHSLKAWQRNRLSEAYEPKQKAKERQEALQDEDQPVAKKKRHVGRFEDVTWDKEGLLEEVKSYEDGKSISWRALAEKYNVMNKQGLLAGNGGQIVKEFLMQNDVDVERFTVEHKAEAGVVRRRKRRMAGGELSVPCQVPPSKVKNKLVEKLQSGEYTIGQMIVPKKVKTNSPK